MSDPRVEAGTVAMFDFLQANYGPDGMTARECRQIIEVVLRRVDAVSSQYEGPLMPERANAQEAE